MTGTYQNLKSKIGAFFLFGMMIMQKLSYRLGFEPQGWDLSLKSGIWALSLGFEPQGWDLSLKAGI